MLGIGKHATILKIYRSISFLSYDIVWCSIKQTDLKKNVGNHSLRNFPVANVFATNSDILEQLAIWKREPCNEQYYSLFKVLKLLYLLVIRRFVRLRIEMRLVIWFSLHRKSDCNMDKKSGKCDMN